MFMCAGEWVTLGLNIPLLFYHLWRYSPITYVWQASAGPMSEWAKPLFFFRFFHRPADGSEVMYDPVSVMNADILNYCQKESWCKLGFYLLSFFYYLYRWAETPNPFSCKHFGKNNYHFPHISLFPAEVWCTPWWASNTKEGTEGNTEIKTQKNEWRRQLFLCPRIIPITGLVFNSDPGQNRKTCLSDNVNVNLMPPLIYSSQT